jgi:DNA modification methylase
MTELRIETVNVNSLTPDPANARKHDGKNLQAIAHSLEKFGQRKPICVTPDSIVVAGNGTLEAAKSLGWTEIVIARTPVGWTWEQIRAFALADNRTAELAEWDDKVLAEQLLELDANGWELEELGFENLEPPAGQDDDDEPLSFDDAPTRAKLGDIWQLGEHRVICGDSTNIDLVQKLMNGHKADMVFTSPPYNADAKAGQGDIFNGKKSVKLYSDGYSDKLPSSEYVKFTSSVLEICFDVTDGYIFWNVSYNAKSRFEYIQQISERLPYLIEQICWKKSSTIPFKGSLMRDWEPVFLFSTNKQPLAVEKVTSNFWEISNTGSQSENHKACFPVALPEKGISIVPNKTGLVFDPFGGTGTTLIACEKTGRIARLMELDPKYCDSIIKRWESYTGKTAELVEE